MSRCITLWRDAIGQWYCISSPLLNELFHRSIRLCTSWWNEIMSLLNINVIGFLLLTPHLGTPCARSFFCSFSVGFDSLTLVRYRHIRSLSGRGALT